MNVLILHDRLSAHPSKDELDTAVEIRQVTQSLLANGQVVTEAPFSLDLSKMKRLIRSRQPDMVFNLVETLEGSRLLFLAPLLCEAMNIPFTGGGSRGMVLSSDKLLAKQVMRGSSVPTPEWREAPAIEDDCPLLGKPVIIKPVAEEASVGITDDSVRTFTTRKELLQVLAPSKERTFFAEQYIEGREFNISVFPIGGKPVVLPPAEMIFENFPTGKPAIVGYEAKWEEDSYAYLHTRRTFDFPASDRLLLDQLKQLCLVCWELFGAKGYARVDIRVDSKGNPYVLEVNLNPCITSDSGFVAACEKAGISYDRMIERIIQG